MSSLVAPSAWTESSLLARLHRRVAPRSLYAEQVRYGGRTADAVWFDADTMIWHAAEVKSSRSDWLRELAQPEKARPFFQTVHSFWLLAPAEEVRYGELPERWGLMVPGSAGGLLTPRTAILRRDYGVPDAFLAAVVLAAVETQARYARAERAREGL